MSLRTTIEALIAGIEGLPVTEGPSYRHARSRPQLDNDRVFIVSVETRLGPQQTGTQHLVDYVVMLTLRLKHRLNDVHADMMRLAEEGSAIARFVEIGLDRPADDQYIVESVELIVDEEGDFDEADIELRLTIRE